MRRAPGGPDNGRSLKEEMVEHPLLAARRWMGARKGGMVLSTAKRQDEPSREERAPEDMLAGPVRPEVSVVLGTLNRRRFLKATIRSIRDSTLGLSSEIVVVDGGSTDRTLRWLARQRDIVTIIQHNGGEWRGLEVPRRSWGYFMNLGFHCASGKYVCMVSDDCILVPGAVEMGIKHLETISSSGVKVGAGAFYFRNWPDEQDYSVQLTLGGRLMVNHGLFLREALADIGWIEEDRYVFYHADSDLCLRLWQSGYEVIDCPNSYVEHYSHADREPRSSRSAVERADWQAYLERWSGLLLDGREGGDMGSRVKKSYHDPSQSTRAFPRTGNRMQRARRSVRGFVGRLARGVLRKIARHRIP
jgi:GT2 family glycosyltransferase